jgi:hypothetical protein
MSAPRRNERPPRPAPRARNTAPDAPRSAESEGDSLGSLKVTFRVSGWVRRALARLAGALVSTVASALNRRPWVLAFLALLLSLLIATLALLGLQAWTAVRVAEVGSP